MLRDFRRLEKHARAVLAVTALAMLAGCTDAGPPADLTFINGAEPESLDPAIITGQPEGRLASTLFEGLLRFNKAGRPVPGVAERWDIWEDGRTYTFHLREDAKWSDGKPVTAADFVSSWERTLTPATGSGYNYMLFPIRNAEAFAAGDIDDFSKVGVTALDDRTLRVELDSPTPYFLDLVAFTTYKPVRTDLIDRVGDDWVKPEHIITNGPYRLESWRINNKIRLEKNPEYWNRDAVALGIVDVLPISVANTAFNFYASGEADLVMDKGLAPPSLLDALKQRNDFHAAPFLGTYFLRFNATKPPFYDPRVRKALAMTIDKQAITEKITRAGETPADGFVPPGVEGYGAPDGLPFDPDQARKLLAEAGYPDGAGFPLVTYLYSEGELNEAIAVELQNMWSKELGININLARQEWKVYLNSLSSLDYDIARSSWVGDYPDPNTFLDMFLAGGGNNRTGWSSEEYDRLIHAAAAELDPEERLRILEQAEQLLVEEEAPIAPIYFYVGIQLYDPEKIGGIEPNLLDEHPIADMYRK